MDFFENRYYNATRICLSLIGLWPYTEPKTKLMRTLLVNVIVFGLFVVQIGTVFTLEFDYNDLGAEAAINFCSFLCVIVMYYNILFNTSKVQKLLNNIKNDWLEREGTKEFEIMKEYAEKCRIFSLGSLMVFYSSVIVITLISALPIIFDILIPLNVTRIRTLPFPATFFVDVQENYYSLALLSLAMMSILGLAVVSCYSLFIIFIQHLCGMFYVVGNILDSAYNSNIPITNEYFEKEFYAKVVLGIKYHKKALEFDAGFNSLYKISSFILMITGALVLVCQFLRVLRTDSFEAHHLRRTTLTIIHVFLNLGTLFIKCHLGQQIIDHSTFLFDKAFDTSWYVFSKRSQILIWFMMVRSMKPCYLSIGDLFILSVNFFASMVQTSLSYAMVVYSIESVR